MEAGLTAGFGAVFAIAGWIGLTYVGCRLSTRRWTEDDWERAYDEQRRIR